MEQDIEYLKVQVSTLTTKIDEIYSTLNAVINTISQNTANKDIIMTIDTIDKNIEDLKKQYFIMNSKIENINKMLNTIPKSEPQNTANTDLVVTLEDKIKKIADDLEVLKSIQASTLANLNVDIENLIQENKTLKVESAKKIDELEHLKQQNNVAEPTKQVYAIIFKENGLPENKEWSVALGKEIKLGKDVITFYVPEGTYDYTINKIEGYIAYPDHNKLAVNNNHTIIINFQSTTS